MIGQNRILNTLENIDKNKYPRFSIIVGPKYSGKKLLVNEIANKLEASIIFSDLKVDTIREIIKLAYKQSEPVVYLIADADRMNPAAKNALLKITEEPPRKAYFILTLSDINNTLETLKSRGTIINMEPYTPSQLLDYAKMKDYGLSPQEENIVMNICTVPGEIDLLVRYNILDFHDFVKKVIDNIGIVNGANAFKIGSSLSYKEGDEGWNILLFLKAIMYECRQRIMNNPIPEYRDMILVTSKYLSQLNINGINKSSTIDMWILETRGIWIKD